GRGVRPWPPKWFADLIGVDYFGHVNAVWFDRAATDEAILDVSRLTQLESLHFLAEASDAELAHLKGLAELSGLFLRGTQVTDAGLAHLMGLTKLRKLDLEETGVTDVGLASLKELTNLTVLLRSQPVAQGWASSCAHGSTPNAHRAIDRESAFQPRP